VFTQATWPYRRESEDEKQAEAAKDQQIAF